MTVSLTNTSNRCQVFVLAHETYCKALGECAEKRLGSANRSAFRKARTYHRDVLGLGHSCHLVDWK